MRQVLAVKVDQYLALSADVACPYAIEKPELVTSARTHKRDSVDAIEDEVDGAAQE